jgi:phytoene dehydrogenase-like protein
MPYGKGNRVVAQTEELGDFDVIIIGAGMGGLVAGNGLAKLGYRVLIVEKHIIPGGFTTNFERKDFRFEVSTHLLNGCGPGGAIYEQLRKIDAHDAVEYIELDTLMLWRDLARGVDYRLPVAIGDYVETLAKMFPDQEQGVREFYRKYQKVAEFLFADGKASEEESEALRAQRADCVKDMLDLRGKTGAEILDPYVSNPELIEMMTILTGFFGLQYDEIDAFIFVMGDLSYRVKDQGAYYPKGGSGHMSRVIADLFEERGGTLLLNREVTRLTFTDGLATGIIARKRSGRQVSARSRCIIANSDITALVRDLTPAGTFPADYVRDIEERIPCISAVILYAGLDFDLRDRGITDYEIHATWGERSTSELINEIAKTGDYSRLPAGSATVYSNVDPTCCPPGKSVVSTICFAEPELFKQALDGGRKRGKAYKKLKKQIASQLLEKMGRALDIPDLESHAEVIELATPVTLERYTNHRGGSFVGWKDIPGQGGFDAIPQQSPVENLFLCGQWIFPAGGVSPVISGGNNAVELADEYLRRRG